MVTTVHLIRHCQSMGNVEHRFQGRYDAPVSPEGEKQLALLGLRFRNQPIDAIYTSPLTRAKRTAQAIGQYHKLEIQEEPGLIEIDCGDIENLLLTEVAKQFPVVANQWDVSPDQCCFPGGETMAQVYQRANDALDRIIADNPGRCVIVATHGGVLRNLYARISHGNLEGIRKSEVFGNTGVSTLLAEEGRLTWKAINDLSHLPEDMRRPPTYFSFRALQEPV